MANDYILEEQNKKMEVLDALFQERAQWLRNFKLAEKDVKESTDGLQYINFKKTIVYLPKELTSINNFI